MHLHTRSENEKKMQRKVAFDSRFDGKNKKVKGNRPIILLQRTNDAE